METTNGALGRKLRMALVGGGQGAFIGRVHATAAVLDNRAELVAGALSSDPERAKAFLRRTAMFERTERARSIEEKPRPVVLMKLTIRNNITEINVGTFNGRFFGLSLKNRNDRPLD